MIRLDRLDTRPLYLKSREGPFSHSKIIQMNMADGDDGGLSGSGSIPLRNGQHDNEVTEEYSSTAALAHLG